MVLFIMNADFLIPLIEAYFFLVT